MYLLSISLVCLCFLKHFQFICSRHTVTSLINDPSKVIDNNIYKMKLKNNWVVIRYFWFLVHLNLFEHVILG